MELMLLADSSTGIWMMGKMNICIHLCFGYYAKFMFIFASSSGI